MKYGKQKINNMNFLEEFKEYITSESKISYELVSKHIDDSQKRFSLSRGWNSGEFGKFTDEKIIPNFMIDGVQEKNTCMVYFHTKVGRIGGKVTDWTVDDDGLPLVKSKRRGLLTDKGTIEPFFEYYGGIDETRSPRME